jgi:predicted type IV restriction endonuclease
MAKIPTKVIDRLRAEVPKFQKILTTCRDRDINEADTVAIISDILERVFGMDRYTDITREFSIKGTFVDLAVKTGDKIDYLIEAKAIGISLRDNHLNQAIGYAAKEGVKWVVLTNGIDWQIHRVIVDGQIDNDLAAQFNFLELNTRKKSDLELLFLLCKRSVAKNLIEDFYDRKQAISRYVIGAILGTEEIAKAVRKVVRQINSDVSVTPEEIQEVIIDSIKREVWETEEGKKERARINRALKRKSASQKKIKEAPITPEAPKDRTTE